MTKILKNCLIATAMLLMAGAGFVACGDPFSRAGASEDPNQFTASIEGVVEKGPFVKGTTVTLYELNPETFAQTGRVFTGIVNRDDGGFSLGKVELESPYVLLDATGYYWRETSGSKSSNPLSLKAVARIGENSKVNINIGTHITHKRILSLVESGMDFDEAKAQAESELVEAFFGDGSGFSFENASIFDNDKLLALSVIVLMTGSEPDVTEMIADLMAGVTPELLLKLADKVALRYTSYFGTRNHMETTFPDVAIGPFEGIIIEFWEKIYGLGECSKKRSGALDTVSVENSVNDGKVLACKEIERGSEMYLWNEATDIDISTEGLELVEDGKLIKSKADSTVMYVYDSGRWRMASEGEIYMELGCVETINDSFVVKNRLVNQCDWVYCIPTINGITTGIPVDSSNFVCNSLLSPVWKYFTLFDTPKEFFFNKEVEYGSVVDSRDGKIYRTVDIAGKIWMAENLAYEVKGAECTYSSSIGCYYSWNLAMNASVKDSVVSNQGICMDGWHIPDTTEWNELLEMYDLENLVSEIDWSFGDNKSGLSLAPSSYDVLVHVRLQGSMSDFAYLLVISAQSNNGSGYAFTIEDDAAHFTQMFDSKNSQYRNYSKGVVRCVKDSE